MPEWWIPIATAALTAVAAMAVAAINRRRARASPTDRLNVFIEQIQEDRQAGREQLAATTTIAGQFMAEAVSERAYSISVDNWIAAGMPDPPGKPKRPTPH